jgi:hypothetical protein
MQNKNQKIVSNKNQQTNEESTSTVIKDEDFKTIIKIVELYLPEIYYWKSSLNKTQHKFSGKQHSSVEL